MPSGLNLTAEMPRHGVFHKRVPVVGSGFGNSAAARKEPQIARRTTRKSIKPMRCSILSELFLELNKPNLFSPFGAQQKVPVSFSPFSLLWLVLCNCFCTIALWPVDVVWSPAGHLSKHVQETKKKQLQQNHGCYAKSRSALTKEDVSAQPCVRDEVFVGDYSASFWGILCQQFRWHLPVMFP